MRKVMTRLVHKGKRKEKIRRNMLFLIQIYQVMMKGSQRNDTRRVKKLKNMILKVMIQL